MNELIEDRKWMIIERIRYIRICMQINDSSEWRQMKLLTDDGGGSKLIFACHLFADHRSAKDPFGQRQSVTFVLWDVHALNGLQNYEKLPFV